MIMNFSKILKELINEKGFLQTILTVKSGLKQGQISEWLSGRITSECYNFRILCKTLDVSCNEIHGLSEDQLLNFIMI